MPSSGLPAGGSRQTWSSSSNVRRQPSADSQKLAILAGSAVSMHKHWTRYQPGSRFWSFQWIEGGWLLALSVLLGGGSRPPAAVQAS
jgi:hypothetical protein